MKLVKILILLMVPMALAAQPDRWQQHAKYKMDIDFNTENHQYKGVQNLIYTNNSPDTLVNVFYHLYLNAFQPGSMMDVRSLNIEDPDRRVRDRISKLSPEEIGYVRPTSLTQNGTSVKFVVEGTILEVQLDVPILPGASATFNMDFEAQVPLQIRRTGRDNAEGISYSMAQWYPKMSEYDYMGWHANPYIGREFYGIWGDFDVSITIDSDYMVAASGFLQNPNEIGYGYEDTGTKVKKKKKPVTWNFLANNVHDFVWAADPDYTHSKVDIPDGPTMHFFYQSDTVTDQTWTLLPEYMEKAVPFMNKNFGKYPYDTYSIIQGGDGGMEYPMATLINGRRSLRGLVGVSVHEMFHSWYQMVLGSNESLHSWMDEGFGSHGSAFTMNYLFPRDGDPLSGSYAGYYSLAKSGKEEPMTTHADHYNTNFAYGRAAYSKGSVTIGQLGYIMGQEKAWKAMRRYYDTWKFKHPNPTDFEVIMEKESGLSLDWFFTDWVGTTRTIDYAIRGVEESDGKSIINLTRIGLMPMPIEIVVEKTDGSKQLYYAPLRVMRGEKQEWGDLKPSVIRDWPWTYPSYSFVIDTPKSQIKSVTIDPSKRMADVDQSNNVLELN